MIFNVDQRGVDPLGYLEFRTYSLLRKSSARTFKNRIKHYTNHLEKYTSQQNHIISHVDAWVGKALQFVYSY
jgi:hypothetical protein